MQNLSKDEQDSREKSDILEQEAILLADSLGIAFHYTDNEYSAEVPLLQEEDSGEL